MDEALNDPAIWLAGFGCVVSVIALFYSHYSTLLARKSFKLSLRQDERRQPRIVPYFVSGYIIRRDKVRFYALSISVSNQSDSGNSISFLELQVQYKTSTGDVLTIRIPSDNSPPETVTRSVPCLTIPLRIEAHDTKAGLVVFRMNDELLSGRQVLSYEIIVTDPHEVSSSKDIGNLKEIFDAKQENDN